MARPTKKGLDYFSHDTDASSDEKIEAIRALHGNNGYAFYFIMLERIYRSDVPYIRMGFPPENSAEMIQIFSRKVGISEQEFNLILKSCFRHKLFDEEVYKKEGILTSSGIMKRYENVTGRRNKERERKKVFPRENDTETNSFPQENTSETGESKLNKSKQNKNKYNDEFLREVIILYHEILPDLPKIKVVTAEISKSFNARLKEVPEFLDIQQWKDLFLKISKSDFLMGRQGNDWSAYFKWIVTPKGFSGLINGQYGLNSNNTVQEKSENDRYLERLRNEN